MLRFRFWQRLDYVMLLAIAGLVTFGVLMVHSATCSPSCAGVLSGTTWAARQAMYVALGTIAMAAVAIINYRVYRTFAYLAYAVSIALLAIVLVVGRGEAQFGVRRWIPLGFFDFQPSEIAKLCLVLALARFLGDADGRLSLVRTLFSMAFPLIPMALVWAQPDLGTSLTYPVIWLGMVCVAGVRWLYLGIIVGGMVVFSPLAWFLLREYQRVRIMTFVALLTNPDADPFGEGYNIIQSRIGIGSGGMFGRGWLEGTQSQLDYLRVKQSDFIFSVIAEEVGFAGALVLFTLFVVLLLRITRAGEQAADGFARLTCYGVASMLFFQIVVNLGANLTLLPVTGIPLPLISFGGSAMIAFFCAFGVLMSILIRSGPRSLLWAG
jgi:rod shape determining protein RodA